MIKHMAGLVAALGLGVVGCAADTEAPTMMAAGSAEAGSSAAEEATAEASSALLDPKCVDDCERAWEGRNEACRRLPSAVREPCWRAANLALALCMKLCPEIYPCPPD